MVTAYFNPLCGHSIGLHHVNLQYGYFGSPFSRNQRNRNMSRADYTPTVDNFNKLAKCHRKAVCHLTVTSENKILCTITKLQDTEATAICGVHYR
jgi:hypothetical protein